MKKWVVFLSGIVLLSMNLLKGQDSLYINEFSLDKIVLLNGVFKDAQDLNIQTLLKYDVDRLLEPYLTEAGLIPKGSPFVNWDGLSGHVGGHYLSALAIHYAATGDTACKNRMEYMIKELKACQDANGNGYVGGIPNGKALWAALKTGDFSLYNSAWVPWYNIHKTYAGLRDAWLYGKSETAKQMFFKLCDWGIDIITTLNDTQIQTMLGIEFGGMNEVYADAYQISGDAKYLTIAKKFTHNLIFDAMSSGTDNLDNKHANTQIPKIIGFQRIASLDSAATGYDNAATFFWETVVNKRSLAIGGNSRNEHFPSVSACKEYLTNREGPESCNTYNMLKLTEGLFRSNPDAGYVDYYERALYNHILSTQHPEHGGYVYFTPARPRHYRVYSAPNQAMWCCVGSGMENHGKYGQFIYTHNGMDSLFVNLFIASVLNWEEKGVEITQNTDFPFSDSTLLTISTASASGFKLLLRHPYWVTREEYKILVNGDTLIQNSEPGSFVNIDRSWNNGDQVKIILPMHHHFEELPNVPEYIALLYGPVLLGAKTGNEDQAGLIADDSRWAHIANGSLLSQEKSPIIVCHKDSILDKINPVENEPLTFHAPELFNYQAHYDTLKLEPFFKIHDSRYMMYWMAVTAENYSSILEKLREEEAELLKLDSMTVDGINTGEQQPDADHKMVGSNTFSGVYNDEYYRDAREGGYFSYEMATGQDTLLNLMVRYWGLEGGARTFDILIDDELLVTENVVGKWNISDFVNQTYSIPSSYLRGKNYITIKFQARAGNTAGGVYYLRLLKYTDAEMAIINRTVDEINSGNIDSELSHNIEVDHSYVGSYKNSDFRYSYKDGFFSYKLALNNHYQLSLLITYWGNETGYRTFDIYVDSVSIATENIVDKWNTDDFVAEEYLIPYDLVKGKDTITVKFQATSPNYAGRIFYLRLLENLNVPVKQVYQPDNNFSVYYADDAFIIRDNSGKSNISFKLINQLGVSVASGNLYNGEARISTSYLPNGVYILSFRKNDKYTFIKILK